MSSKLFLFYILYLLLCCTACKKMIEVDLPSNQLVTSAVFSDSATATAAVAGVYSEMMNVSTQLSFGNGNITLTTGLASDELFPTAITNVNDNQFYANGINIDNSSNYALWLQGYKLIYQCNAVINGLDHSPLLTISLKNQLAAESVVLRSLLYFNLVNLFGDVPYVTDIDYSSNAIFPRVTKDIILATLVSDLLSARQLLSSAHISSERVRANKMAATALLSRIYLYQHNWAEAGATASQIITSTAYLLEPVLNNVFLSNSREAIWQLRPVQTSFNTAEGQIFNPTTSASVRPRYAMQPSLLAAFEPGDMRRVNGNWIKSKIVSGTTFYYPFKYKLKSDANPAPSEFYMLFRLAEQYLIRSEASAQQDKLNEALADLNLIRKRAGLPDVSTSSKSTLLAAIEHERQVEFFAEGGHRWFDLKRLKRADAVLSLVKSPTWQSTDELFPVPFTELQRNPFLQQNPGY